MSTAQKIEATQETALQGIRRVLAREFKERDALVDVLMTGLLAKENVFVLGPPGTGKTEIARALAAATGGKFFWTLMTKVSTAEELFGGYDIKALRDHSLVRRNTAGRLPEAHIAVLDELPRASSAVLGTTFSLLNERVFFNGGNMEPSPLMSAIATANHLLDGDTDAALFARFCLRIQVDYIKDKSSFLDMIEHGLNLKDLPHLSLAQLQDEQAQVQKVVFSAETRELIGKVREEILKAGISVGDRTWRKSVLILKAYAHLNGRVEIAEDDFDILSHVLWSEVEQVREVRRIVAKIANPIGDQLLEIKEGFQALFDEAGSDASKLAMTIPKAGTLIENFEKLAKGRESNPKIASTQLYLRDLYEKMVSGLTKRRTSVLGVSLNGKS